MGFIRAVIGIIIGFFMFKNNVWSNPFTVAIIKALPIPEGFRWVAFYLIFGLVIGLIAGSSIWGAASTFGVIILMFISEGIVPDPDMIFNLFRDTEASLLLFFVLGGFIGGVISGSLSEEDDYLILRLKDR